MAFDPKSIDPLAPPPQEYPKTVYVDAAKPAPPQRTDGQVPVVVHNPEQEKRALAGEPLDAPVADRIPEPTIQERQAYEKVVAYERQNMSRPEQARLAKRDAASARPVRKASKKASKPVRKVAKKSKAGKKAGKR